MKLKDYLLVEEEEANLRPELTGLPVIVWVSVGVHMKHGPRIKVQNKNGLKVSYENLIPITIEDEPKNIENYKIDKKLFDNIKKWIILNKVILLKYWKGDIFTDVMIKGIKKI